MQYTAMIRAHSPDGSKQAFQRAVLDNRMGPEAKAYRCGGQPGCVAGRGVEALGEQWGGDGGAQGGRQDEKNWGFLTG